MNAVAYFLVVIFTYADPSLGSEGRMFTWPVDQSTCETQAARPETIRVRPLEGVAVSRVEAHCIPVDQAGLDLLEITIPEYEAKL